MTILNQIRDYIAQTDRVDNDLKNELLSTINNDNIENIKMDYPSRCYLTYLANSEQNLLYQTVVEYINNQSFQSVKYLICLIKLKYE